MKKEIGEVVKHTTIYGIGIAVSRLTSFIMLPIYTHYLTPEHYGTLELIVMTLDIVATFIGLRLASGVIRFYYQYEDSKERNQVISSSLIASILIFLFFSALFYQYSHVFSRIVFRSDEYTLFFKIMFINLFFTSCVQIPLSFIQARKRSILFVLVNLARLFIQLSLNIYFLVFLGMKVEGVLYSTLATSAMVGIYLTLITFRDVGFAFNKEKFFEVAKFTAPLMVSFFGMFILTYSDRYFLNLYFTLDVVGTYALGYKFGYVVSTFVMLPFGRIWSVYQYEISKKEEAAHLFRKFFTYFNLMLITSSLFMAIFSKEVIRIMANKSFFDAYKIVGIILAVYVVYSWFHFTHIGILLKKKTKYLAATTVVAAAFMILFNMTLIPLYGAIGAAVGTFFAYFIRFLLTYFISQRLYRVNYEWQKVFLILIVSVCLYGLSVLVERDSLLLSISYKSLVFLMFPIAVYFSPILDKLEKLELRKFLANPYSWLKNMRVF